MKALIIAIYVGFSVGGTTDTVARFLADEMDNAVVINKTGAAGKLAAEYVRKAKPDGRTLYMTNSVAMARTEVDLHLIRCVGNLKTVLAVAHDSPFMSAEQLYENASGMKWASAGVKSASGQFGANDLLKFKIEATQIPFRGGTKARNALMAGKVDFAYLSQRSAAGHVRILSILDADNPVCVYVHPDTSIEKLSDLNDIVINAAASDVFQERMKKVGIETR